MTKSDNPSGLSERMIEITKRDEVWSILNEIYRSKSPVEIWQKIPSQRNARIALVGKVSQMDEGLILVSKTEDPFSYDLSQPLYFHSKYRTAIFKAKILKMGPRKIQVSRPEALKIEEARQFARSKFGLRSYQYVEIILQTDQVNTLSFKTSLLDSSEGGLGFMVEKKYAPYLEKGVQLSTGFSTREEARNKTAIVRSVTTMKNTLTGENLLRVGVEFS